MLTSRLRIGELDRKVRIESATETQDTTTNAPVRTWAEFKTVWAKRMFRSSAERYESNQQVGATVYNYLIRHLEGVTQQMRVVDDGETYFINGVEVGDRRNSIILTVQKRDG